MALAEIKFSSEALGRQAACLVRLPDSGEGPFRAMFLLHGLWGGYADWQRFSRFEKIVADSPLAIILPDGGRSFYCNIGPSENYETFLAQELPAQLQRWLRIEGPFGIAGLSMGGYGALRTAFRHPGLFPCAYSLSGALGFAREPSYAPGEDLNRIFGGQVGQPDFDLIELVRSRLGQPMPTIAFDCGTEDHLLESNRRFQAFLASHEISHSYCEYPGAHDWAYWDTHLGKAVEFVESCLVVPRI